MRIIATLLLIAMMVTNASAFSLFGISTTSNDITINLESMADTANSIDDWKGMDNFEGNILVIVDGNDYYYSVSNHVVTFNEGTTDDYEYKVSLTNQNVQMLQGILESYGENGKLSTYQYAKCFYLFQVTPIEKSNGESLELPQKNFAAKMAGYL